MVLGSWPTTRDSKSWITQRLVNRAPAWTIARRIPYSVMQQVMDPIGNEIEDNIKKLVEERYNMFLGSANINLIDRLYKANLSPGMTFNSDETPDGRTIYAPPTVYAIVNGVEQQITIAHNNDIESLWYTALPSRVEYSEISRVYDEVIPRTQISSLDSALPESISVDGSLYITIRDNDNWEYRASDRIYYPKVYVSGITRKGTTHTEAIPLRYNGTFKTVYQWQEVTSIFVSYVSDTAYLTVESFPFDAESQLDSRNLVVPVEGLEKIGFNRLGTQSWGSTYILESFADGDMDAVRAGFDTKEVDYEIELLDNSGNNIDAVAFVKKPNTDYIFVIDDTKLYVYNERLPYPDLKRLTGESASTRMDLYPDRWVYPRGSTATIATQTLDITNPPTQIRWTLEDPNEVKYYVGQDGSLWPTTTDAWITNLRWDDDIWQEQKLELTLSTSGTYILGLECLYEETESGVAETLTTKILLHVPAIRPEVEFTLPSEVLNSDNIGLDSDGKIWFLKSGTIYNTDIYYDYFLADYENNTIWLREDYTSVRIVI